MLVPQEEEENGSTGLRSRKRRKLNGFKKKAMGLVHEEPEARIKGKEKVGKPELDKSKSSVSDGVREVGRLCIWCVKM